MIYCITQPLEKYSVNLMGFDVGPIHEYKNQPGLMNIVSFFSPFLYQWEEGTLVPQDSRSINTSPKVELLMLRTLDFKVKGASIRAMLEACKDPADFLTKILKVNLGTLPLKEFYCKDNIETILTARVYSWAKFQGCVLSLPLVKGIVPTINQYKINEEFVKEHAFGKFCQVH